MSEYDKMEPEEREIEQKMIKVISQMPASVQGRFKVLHMLSDERSKINDEFEIAAKKISAKFALLKRPHLEKRNAIVRGEETDFAEYVPKFDASVPALETIVAGITKASKDDDDEEEKEHVPTDVSGLVGKVGVPDFWGKAVKNNQILMQAVREKDADVMAHLIDVTAERNEEANNLSISTKWSENQWFTNSELTFSVRYKGDS